MYNKWICNTSNNEEFMFANLAIKNIEFALISIEHIFNEHIDYKLYKDDYTFYFYYLQNLLDACGCIADIFKNNCWIRDNVQWSHRNKEVLGFVVFLGLIRKIIH